MNVATRVKINKKEECGKGYNTTNFNIIDLVDQLLLSDSQNITTDKEVAIDGRGNEVVL